eukprot:3201009-Pleurochrysis_carterae.AAC.2
MPGQGMRVSACTIACHANHDERLCEGERFVPSHSAAVGRARQRRHGQVVPRSGQCRRCVRARAGSGTLSQTGEDQDVIVRVFRGRAEAKLENRGREVSCDAASARACGWADGWEALTTLAVLQARGPAQQPELGLRWVDAERRRARWERHKPRTHRAGRGAADNQLYSGGGDEQRGGSWSCACVASTVVGAAAAIGAAGVSTEGAGKGALAAEDEAPAEVALRRRLAGWLCTDGNGCVRGHGVPRATASSGLSSSPGT